jgi:hypothetical protein
MHFGNGTRPARKKVSPVFKFSSLVLCVDVLYRHRLIPKKNTNCNIRRKRGLAARDTVLLISTVVSSLRYIFGIR